MYAFKQIYLVLDVKVHCTSCLTNFQEYILKQDNNKKYEKQWKKQY